MKFLVTHKTEYTYSEPVSICYNEGWLVPRPTNHQSIVKNELTVSPQPMDYEIKDDFYGNKVSSFSLTQRHNKLRVISKTEIDLQPANYSSGLFGSVSWENAVKQLGSLTADILEARQFVLESPMIIINEEIRQYAAPSFEVGRPIFEASLDLIRRIYKDFKFVPGFTTIATPLTEVLKQKKGVCQDFAHLAIACIRSMGLAARYISGYIETLPPPGKEKLVGADASHAWISVFIPGTGWVDFDPTNNLIPSNQHITVAWGRDYSDVSPLRGVIFTVGSHKLAVSVDVKKM